MFQVCRHNPQISSLDAAESDLESDQKCAATRGLFTLCLWIDQFCHVSHRADSFFVCSPSIKRRGRAPGMVVFHRAFQVSMFCLLISFL
jgi:hypothetical protein